MKYLIDNIKVSPTDNTDLYRILAQRLNIKDFKYKILSKSLDARDKTKILYIYRFMVETEEKIKHKNASKYIEKKVDVKYNKWNDKRPVVVGFGPAGMFSALYLARCGAKPIILERGKMIDERKKDVNTFIETKVLNTNSNIQFGEGGAGTFSDGKLTTNVKDPLISFILEELHKHGALENVLYESKPHIGTDYLEKIVKSIREEIISLGGEFFFSHIFTKATTNSDGTVRAYATNLITNNEVYFNTKHILLGLGHSARDTIKNLYDMNLSMEQKGFSMGVRVEHPQALINDSQNGKIAYSLPAASYKLATRANDRGVYTFCMCPGGYLMASQSEEHTIVTNGMSNNARDAINSNSAVLVDVKPSDYNKGHVLDGMHYQEKYERLAFEISGDYRAPANLFKEFLMNEVAKEERSIKTSYPHGLCFTDLNKCLPDYVVEGLKCGIVDFDKKLKGFNHPDAIMIGIESRSSSPVRILRDENRESSFKGIYPIGEGAGYAGGITSAALDGLKTAIKISGGH